MGSGLDALLGSKPLIPDHRVEKFCSAQATPGPHPIPRRRQVANQFHRIFSIKAGMRVVSCESPLEADAVIFAEARPEVVSLCEQPLRIQAPVKNRPYYTFDLRLSFRDGTSILYEIKQSSRLEALLLQPSYWSLVQAWCKANGERCAVLTEQEFEAETQRIENWRTLLPFAVRAYESPDPELEESLLCLITRASVFSFAGIFARERHASEEALTAHLAKLLHQGKFTADLSTAPVSPATELHVPETDHA